MARIITVTILCAALPDGGEAIVPTLPDLCEQERVLQNALDEMQMQYDASEIDAEKETLLPRIKGLQAELRRYALRKKQQPAAASKAVQVQYKIGIPTYGEMRLIEEAAREETDGIAKINEVKLLDASLPVMFAPQFPGEDIRERADALPATHVRLCWARWRREVYPTLSDIPFLDGVYPAGDSGNTQ